MKNGHLVLVATLATLAASGCKPADEKDAEACLAGTHGPERGTRCLPVCSAATSPKAVTGACAAVQLEAGYCADKWKEAHPDGKAYEPAIMKNSEWAKQREACRALCTAIGGAKLAEDRFPAQSRGECEVVAKSTD